MLANMKRLILTVGLLGIAAPLYSQAGAKPAAVTCSIANPAKTDADRLFAGGKFAEAEGLYTQQVSTSPSEAAWRGLVHTEIELNKVPEALAAAARANAAMPQSAAMRVLTGDAELRAGHLDEASAAYADARALDPCSAAAHFGTARMLELSSMHKSAQRELAFAHRLAPGDAAISEALFATLPAAMHAKGLHNLLTSDQDLTAEHRAKLEQEVALLDAGATCHGAETGGITKVDLTPLYFDGTHLRDWGIRVGSAEGAAVNLELDSTVSGIVLSETDAKKLKVRPSVADHQSAPYLGYLASIQVGQLHYEKCPVAVVPDAALATRYSVIGTDFFRDSLIHLDWNAKQITLTPYGDQGPSTGGGALVDASVPAGEEKWAHVFIDKQRILMPSLVEKKSVGLLMLDTSYTVQMLSPSAAKPLGTTADATLAVVGVSGDYVRIFMKEGGGDLDRSQLLDSTGHDMLIRSVGTAEAVRFAGVEAPHFGLWSFDITHISHAAGLEVGGIIGYGIIQQYYIDIDYQNGLVNFNYDLAFPLRQAALRSE
jgi:hypothetical protein